MPSLPFQIRSPIPALAALGFAVLAAGCSTPADLDLSLDKQTAAGIYHVALQPPAQAPAINQMHAWKVKLATTDGSPVRAATFKVDGGMPQHGHGLPTQPRVTRELEPGTYLIDAMRLVDTAAVAQGLVEHPQQWLACSAAHHVGQRFDPLVTVHSGYWRLGNTPFERERAYGRLCGEPLPRRVSDEIQRATDGGWALGDGSFLAALAKLQARRLQPRRRGRVPSSKESL